LTLCVDAVESAVSLYQRAFDVENKVVGLHLLVPMHQQIRNIAHSRLGIQMRGNRFASARQVSNYFGLVSSEQFSGGKQRLGGTSKSGNSFLLRRLRTAGSG